MQNLFSKNNHLNAIFTRPTTTFYHLTHISVTDELLLHTISFKKALTELTFYHTIN